MSIPSLKQQIGNIQKSTWLTIVGTTILFLTFFIQNPSYMWIDLWFMFEIFVLTFSTKTVSLRYGFTLFSEGVLIGGMGSIIMWRIAGILGLHDTTIGEGIMATLEEVLKFLPVAIALFLVSRNKKPPFNLSDILFLSVMCGAGFSMFEKSFWQGVSFPFTYGPHIGPIYFFSDALGIFVNDQKFGYIGHAAATGLIGMGIAIGLFLKNKNHLFWWVFPAFTFIWIAGEHILSNLYYVTGTEALLAFGGGLLTPWIFLAFLVAVLILDGKRLHQFLQTHSEEKALLKKNRQTFFHSIKTKKPDVESGLAFVRKLRAINSLAYDTETPIQKI